MAAMMRANGQTEEHLEKFVEQMKSVQKMSKEMQSHQAEGLTEMQAARKAAGASDKELAEMDKMDKDFAKMGNRSFDISMQRKRAEFEKEHGDKPDASVTLGSQIYSLKILECELSGDTFVISAEGPPGPERLHFHTRKSLAYGMGPGYMKGLSFRAGDLGAGLGHKTGEVSGKRFTFAGTSNVTNTKTGDRYEEQLKVDLTCH